MNHNYHGSSEDKTQDKSPFNAFILDHKQLKPLLLFPNVTQQEI